MTLTLASDDPGMFDTTLNAEYLLVHTRFGVDRAGLADLARTGGEVSYAPAPLRCRLLAEIDAHATG